MRKLPRQCRLRFNLKRSRSSVYTALGSPERYVRFALSTPRLIWSRSIDSNSARKLPSPNPSLPLRWMISKKIGPMTFCVKICSSVPSFFCGLPSIRMLRLYSSASFS
jgi:hypothetical protein